MTRQSRLTHNEDRDWLAIWEDAGSHAIEQDLIKSDGKRYCGGMGDVRRAAWQWLRAKRVESLQSAYGRGRK